jgi:hypothetical protein
MGKSRFYKSDSAQQTLSFFDKPKTPTSTKSESDRKSLILAQDALAARQLVAASVWEQRFESLVQCVETLQSGEVNLQFPCALKRQLYIAHPWLTSAAKRKAFKCCRICIHNHHALLCP